MTVIDVGPAKLDLLRVRAGDRNKFNVQLTDSRGPVNLTNTTIEAQARVTPVDTEIAVTAAITMIDATQGRFQLSWPGEDVRAILNGSDSWKGVWDLQMTPDGEDPQTLVAGQFTVESDVTR